MSRTKKFTVMVPIQCEVDPDADLRVIWRSIQRHVTEVAAGSYRYVVHADKVRWRDVKEAADNGSAGS